MNPLRTIHFGLYVVDLGLVEFISCQAITWNAMALSVYLGHLVSIEGAPTPN